MRAAQLREIQSNFVSHPLTIELRNEARQSALTLDDTPTRQSDTSRRWKCKQNFQCNFSKEKSATKLQSREVKSRSVEVSVDSCIWTDSVLHLDRFCFFVCYREANKVFMSFRDLVVEWILKVSVKIDAKNKRLSIYDQRKARNKKCERKTVDFLPVLLSCVNRVEMRSLLRI